MLKLALLILLAAARTPGATPGFPIYTADSVANAAANVAGYYAANTFLSIYGQNLAYQTLALGANEVHGGMLPTVLPGTGVRVLVNHVPAYMFFASPNQVNVLLPPSIGVGPATLQLLNDTLAGPAVIINLGAAAPAFFQIDAKTVIATHADGLLVTDAAPARRSEIVVLWAAGLGDTNPPTVSGQLALGAAPLARIGDFHVWLNGIAADAPAIKYAGVTAGFAGLFQINLQIPANTTANPEIRIGYAEPQSPPGRFLPLQ